MAFYNLADLEEHLPELGWTLQAASYVTPQQLPGQVFHGGFIVTLTSATCGTFSADAATRADALRDAAQSAGLLPVGTPRLS